MRPLQWGEHTTCIYTDSVILNANFRHPTFSFVFITNSPVFLVVSHKPLTPRDLGWMPGHRMWDL